MIYMKQKNGGVAYAGFKRLVYIKYPGLLDHSTAFLLILFMLNPIFIGAPCIYISCNFQLLSIDQQLEDPG